MSDDVFSSYYDPSAADEGVYVKYVSTKTYDDNNANTLEDMFQILISKEVYEDADFSGEPMEVSVIQQLDFICDDFQCSVLREDINVPLSDYVTLQDTDAFVSDLDYSYLITSNQVEIQYPYYHYQDTEKSFTTIRYSNFKDYQPLFFEHNTKSYTNFFNRPIERETFKYGGNDYLEHGDYYSIIYKMDYGFKVVNKLATMEGQTSFDDMLVFSSSVMFDADHFYRVENIYDYGLRASYNLSERDEIIYQENPLIFSLFEIVD